VLRTLAFALALPLAPLSGLGHLQAAPALGPLGPEGVPVPNAPALAPRGSPALGQSVDGIKCEQHEQVLFHIHAHLTIVVDGKARQVPYGIGIAPPISGQNTSSGPFVTNGTCFSWLHTHAGDGIVHIESPVERTFTLGEFFDVWKQPLGPNEAGPAHGRVVVIYDGKWFKGNPRSVPLTKHAQIQLEVGKPLVAPEKITFPRSL